MKVPAQRPMIWNEGLEETTLFYVDGVGFSCFDTNDDRGLASLLFGGEFEAI